MDAPSTSGRSWTEWVESFFIPVGTENNEQYSRRRDPTQEHDGYQLSADEEETEQRYKRTLAEARADAAADDLADIAGLGIVTLPGVKDKNGRPVVLVLARRLPATTIDTERLFRHVVTLLDETVDAPYCVVYVHTGATYWSNSPGLFWLRSMHDRLALKYKRNLHKLYMVHSDLALWLLMSVACPFMPYGFWAKVAFIPRVDLLWEFISEKALAPFLPSYVNTHDEFLEENPLPKEAYISMGYPAPEP